MIVSYPNGKESCLEDHGRGWGDQKLCIDRKAHQPSWGLESWLDRCWFLTTGFQIKEPGQVLLPILLSLEAISME